MDATRIATLLEAFLAPADEQALTRDDLDCISMYINILLRWNARINLTAIREPDQIVTRHFGESFLAARCLFPNRVGTAGVRPGRVERVEARRPSEPSAGAEVPDSTAGVPGGRAAVQGRKRGVHEGKALAPEGATTLADVGSGAGFPGLPIKLWAPDISLTLIESNHKKATFLREVTRALTLTNVNIENVRAETLPPASFDLVTLRAVEHFATILPTAAGLARPGGRLALLIGAAQLAEVQSSLPGFNWSEPIQIPASASRVLLIGRTV